MSLSFAVIFFICVNTKVNFFSVETREQYFAKNWGKERYYRFTASIHNNLKEKKTERGFSTLTKQVLAKRQGKALPNVIVKTK